MGLVTLLLFVAIVGRLAAQEAPEVRAFKAAGAMFEDGAFDLAERQFRQFIAVYPQSPMLAEAILLQARASMKLGRLTAAVSLLNSNLAQAGPLADQFRYRIGEAHMQGSNYLAAAESFAALARDFTNSALLLEASHDEALARYKVRDFARVAVLLQSPDGAFQRAARARPTDVLTARGRLLLVDVLIEQSKLAEAEKAVTALTEDDLAPDLKWDRQYALCRILLAGRRLPEALTGATNLVSLAIGTAKPGLKADSFALEASILSQLDRPEAAIQVYTNNLADSVPADRRRLAILQIIELQIAQEQLADAAQSLDSFIAKHPDDAASDAVLLALGEIYLRLHLTPAGANGTNVAAVATNRLQQAQTQFDRVLAGFTNDPVRGKAFLNKGWCLWLDNKPAEAAQAFQAAVELLPPSEDSAVARFKLADAQFKLGDITNALAGYRAVAQEASNIPRVRDHLLPQTIYQIARVAMQAGDFAGADAAMRQLLQADSPLAAGGMLLLGQALNDAADPARARQLYGEFAKRFPTSSLLPMVQFERARTYADAGEWPAAIGEHERWLEQFTTNDLIPKVEFSLAWAHWRAGAETNALNLFTNFLARYPTNDLAPQAQFWVGDYFMRQADFFNAQRTYQGIIENTNWPVTNLTYRARFAAGRAAFNRQDWKGAGGKTGHFTLLVNDDNCPKDIMAEAFLALGDTKVFLPLEDANALQPDQDRMLERQAEAKRTFERIPQLFATNEMAQRFVPVAWGRIGDCALQLASRDPNLYSSATNAYWRIVTNAAAGPALRQMAEYGIGRALALQAFDAQARGGPSAEVTNLLSAALEHYYNVVLAAGPLAQIDPGPFWIKEAGFAGAKLAEDRRQWKIAVGIYERMAVALPPLRPRLQEKIDKAREQLRLEGN